MTTRNCHSRGRPTWRIWVASCLGRLCNIKNLVSARRRNLIPAGLPFTVGLVLLFAVSKFWPAFQMAAAGAALVLVLQEIAEPSPLFLTVPWEALELVLSRRARANHFWLHRTQEFLQKSAVRCAKADGFATREGFILMGASLNETQIRSASWSAWRTLSQESSLTGGGPGCKTMQVLLALWLIIGGLTALSLWRRVDLVGWLLLSTLCGAASHLLVRPAEKLLGPWTDYVASSNDKIWPNCLEVEVHSFAIPSFLWFKKGIVFQVRRIAGNEASPGAGT